MSSLGKNELSRPSPGDAVVVDFVPDGFDWYNRREVLRHALHEEVRLVGILSSGQLRTLGKRGLLDDFLVEGFAPEELSTRVRWQIGEAITEESSRRLEIDEDRYEVRLDGTPVELTFKEFELLRFLAARPGKVFTREMLLEQVWGYDYFGGSRTVDVHIRRIRSKIEREDHAYIKTIRGVGYIFEPEPPP